MVERALPEVEAAVLAIVQGDPDVQQANGILAAHMGPEEIVAALSIEFEDRLTAPEIEACVERLEAKVRAASQKSPRCSSSRRRPEPGKSAACFYRNSERPSRCGLRPAVAKNVPAGIAPYIALPAC